MRWSSSSSMLCLMYLSIGLSTGRAGETIPPKIVQATKEATVFIKIKAGAVEGSGSGFLIKVDGETAYIATNDHVAFPRLNRTIIFPGGIRGIPGGIPRGIPEVIQDKDVRPDVPAAGITVLFHSGTKREQAHEAEVVAADPERDLAILKINGAKDLPPPLDVAPVTELVETMQVYGFGFPLGKTLATGKRNPAVTVTRASISGIRTNEQDELVKVQIDGALNPGNSGGPVLDTKGRLVGVVNSGVSGSGIAFAVPAHELTKALAGRLGLSSLSLKKREMDQAALVARVNLIDPMGKIKAVSLHYLPTNSLAGIAAADKERLDTVAGVVTIKLTIEKQSAAGEFAIALPEKGTVSWQVSQANAEGKTIFANIQIFDPSNRKVAAGVGPGEKPRLPAPLGPRVPGSLDQAVEWLSGSIFEQMAAADYLSTAEVLKPRQAEVGAALTNLLTDRNTILRQKTLAALMYWATSEQVPALLRSLDDSSPFIRKKAIEALGSVPDERAVAPVAKFLPSFFEREVASRALVRMGPMVEAEVRKYLGHPDNRTHSEAVRILREIGKEVK